MKKYSLTVLALCLAVSQVLDLSTLKAEPVSKQAALYTAQSYMLAKGKQINVSQRPHKAAPYSSGEVGEEEEAAYYYVFNAGGNNGYVIISGDDRTEPVLGYVEQGSFDPENIPENMRSWLQFYADEIKYIIDNNIDPNSPVLKKRNKVRATKHSVPELMKSRWNQGKPYNLTCPDYYTDKDNDVHHYPATGCAATAMAQVINYYKFPLKTKAAIPSHSKTYTLKNGSQKTVTVKGVPRGTAIDWENMQDTYSYGDGHVDNAQDSAVANLMLYCGQSLKMSWGASSGADTSKSRDALVNYFGFDARAFWASRPSYSIDEWFDMLYDEMEAGYPVLYRGHSSGGGHAFVLDGFDGENLFHVNWGWGGGSNGWFLVGILNPGDTSGMGASSSSDGYSMTQGGVFNLRTPDTPKDDPALYISDVTITGTSIKAKFTNKTGSKNSFHAGIVMQSEDGGLELVGTRQIITGLDNGASAEKTFPMRNRLPEGTYRLSPASKSSRNEEWHAKYNLSYEYIEAVVDSLGGVDLHFNHPTYEDISIDTIAFPGTRIVNQEQEVKVTFRNNGAEYFKTVYLFASKTNTKVYTESKSMVAIRSGETMDVSYFFKPEETGTYNLWLCTDDKGNGVIGQGTIEIITEEDAVKANLSVSSFTIGNGSGEVVYGKRLIGKAVIKNNKTEDFHGNVRIQLWSQKVGSNTAHSGSSRTYNVDIVASKTTTIEYEFDNLSEGYYYRLKVMYGNQDGTLGNGGLWDHKWEMRAGVLTWKNDGTVVGQAYRSVMSAGSNCGFYADCSKINRVTTNANPNTIYAFAANMELPTNLDDYNVVSGNHARHINMVHDKPFYVPVSFDADSAFFTYTFPETEAGTGWHALTMPFAADSVLLENSVVALDDSTNHFWIYEFVAEGDNGEAIFRPAKVLRSGTPYIIAGDSTMAGRSIFFHSLNVPFFKTGTDKMLVTSPSYRFHGNTLAPRVKNCYVLNEDGTAFEYVSLTHTLSALNSYFTTTLPEELRPASIVLPDVPVAPILDIALDENASDVTLAAGTYTTITLKRTFEAGLNTICLPFAIDDVPAIFGQDAQAFEFCGYTADGQLDFVPVSSLAAGLPYIISLQDAITEDIVLSNVRIDAQGLEAGAVSKCGACFRGTYLPFHAAEYTKEIHGLTADGQLVKLGNEDEVKGFRAFFDLPATAENVSLHFFDDATAIGKMESGERKTGNDVYDLSGRKRSMGQKGIFIINGKKVLK